jgi:TolA-binding protein
VQPAPHGRSAIEQHFAAGYALLQQGKPAEAARELATAADSDGDPALAADARYFQAIALARAGRKTEAEAALVAFLDHAPRSLRRGRAAVMLAKLIAERGDRDSARRWFESALGDPDPAVVAAARAGIAGL